MYYDNNIRLIRAIVLAVLLLLPAQLYSADQLDNDNSATGFGGGTNTGTQRDR